MRTFLQPALILIGAKRISSVGCFLRLVLFSNQVLSRFFRNIPPTELVIADPDNCLISAFEVIGNNAIGNVEPIAYLIAIVTIVSAPVIKCQKTPRKKCRFVAEVRKKR